MPAWHRPPLPPPQMADLPLDPALARMLLAAGEMGCTAEVLTVVAMLSVQSVWAPGGKREVDEAKARCEFSRWWRRVLPS